MADVFISYKSERRAAAEHLAEILADYGYSVWWDYGLVSGRDFGAQIEQELRAAKAVVVLWCSLSRDSEWVLDEATLAKNLGTIIPTTIERIDLPLGFGRAQTLDLSDWDGAPQSHKLERLLRDIAAKVGRAPASNLEGLDRTERAWRRFGAPSLAQFALITPLERQELTHTLPRHTERSATSPSYSAPAQNEDVRRRTKFSSALMVSAALVLIAASVGGTAALFNASDHARDSIEAVASSPTSAVTPPPSVAALPPASAPAEVTPSNAETRPAPPPAAALPPASAPAEVTPSSAEMPPAPPPRAAAAPRLAAPPSRVAEQFLGEWRLGSGVGCGGFPWRIIRSESGSVYRETFNPREQRWTRRAGDLLLLRAEQPPELEFESGITTLRLVDGGIQVRFFEGRDVSCTLARQ